MKSGRFIGVSQAPALMVLMLCWRQLMNTGRTAGKFELADPGVSETGCTGICQGQQLTLSQFGQLDTQLGDFLLMRSMPCLRNKTCRREYRCDRLSRSNRLA